MQVKTTKPDGHKVPTLNIVRTIGNGAFGKLLLTILTVVGYVFEAVDQNSGKTVALKRTQKAGKVISREF